ncbi:hypothetical protein I4U23_007147 [Adineta vaga]|nr:hypothetical protein I4U23_007147 [Adineta vaga]
MDMLRLQTNANSTSNDMMDKAKRVWSMLDELASSDPSAYKNYIQKTLTEGKEWMKPPTPCFAVRSLLCDNLKTKVFYLNVFTWLRLPAPEKTDESIKMYPLTPTEMKHHNESCMIMNVAVHPNILENISRAHLIQSILNLVTSQYKLLVDHDQYEILDDKTIGNLEEIQRTFVKPISKNDKNNENVEDVFNKDLSPSLIKQLSSMTISNQSSSSSNKQELQQQLPKKIVKSPVLIEELWTIPTFTEKISADKKSLIIRISLPDCESVADCDLSILRHEEIIQMECSKLHTRLNLDMKQRNKQDINPNSTFSIQNLTAKFVRKTQQLVLTIPINSESITNGENK